jgi:hypothetical protein
MDPIQAVSEGVHPRLETTGSTSAIDVVGCLATPSSALQIQSGIVQNVPTLEIQSTAALQSPIVSVPSIFSPSLQVKTEGLSTPSPLTMTDMTPQRSIDHTVVPIIVTGTGSVTATPTAYTTTVTTLATSTTSMTSQDSSGVLGKRIRRTSTKYEDFEQPLTRVPKVDKEIEDKEIEKEDCTTGRLTNQLQYLKSIHRILWRHHYAWPFHKPVDPVSLNIPVRLTCCTMLWLYCTNF